MHTDLPLPVAPATNKCGVLFISMNIVLPIMFLPNATTSLLLSIDLGISSIISLNDTPTLVLFGSSIPIVLLPGIGACILTSFAARASAISLCILNTLFTFVPLLSSTSYCVTEGPTFISTTLPTMSKSLNTFSNLVTLSFITFLFSLVFTLGGFFNICLKSGST